GIDRGYLQLWQNDGTGQFTNVSAETGLLDAGAGWWMGLSFGDVNGDGRLDFFGSNFGDYGITLISPIDPVYADFFNYDLGRGTSRWLLGQEDGTFLDPGVGNLMATPFGWGTSMVDYDNDADTDIIFHGGLNPGTIVQTAPGVMLRNQGLGEFERDEVALAASTDHERRAVQGMAVGDLDDNGFADIVSVSNFDIPADAPLARYNADWGSPFDFGGYLQWFLPSPDPTVLPFSGILLENGTLSVELSSADNSNRWAKIRLRGTADLSGRANRDGIGAVVTFTTRDGKTTARPVLGGASYASQDSLELGFGLGDQRRGTVDVLWPGGTRNRVYWVRHGERLEIPEIACSYDDNWSSPFAYLGCVLNSLSELRQAGVIDHRKSKRLLASAFRAYIDAQRGL
ncbi:MAG: CRTAC1 family protein, partial [Acidobacteriota bacterium]